LDALIPKYHSLIAFISQLTNDILSIPISLKKQQLNSGAVDHTTSSVNLAFFPHLIMCYWSLACCSLPSSLFMRSPTKHPRDISKKLLIILVASHFKGFGVLFLLLWVSIYV
uniref:Dolichyl-diphosphooligosaccharide-protein glycosyltransferase subunit TMEM258 n=1 Tax=Sus scrofa TaxID=9823 RepID=A0A8D0WS79_PIG